MKELIAVLTVVFLIVTLAGCIQANTAGQQNNSSAVKVKVAVVQQEKDIQQNITALEDSMKDIKSLLGK